MKLVLLTLMGFIVAGLIYIRTAPSDPDRWHVDPVAAGDPGSKGIRIAPGVITSALFPKALLEEIDEVVLAEPRVAVLAGSVADGQVTYVFRSKLMGFPDYLTVRGVSHDAGSSLAVLSRLRFGQSDSGVNEARLQRLLHKLRPGVLRTR